jgi:hypothetical protein
MHHQASSLAFQETLRELMAKKEEAIVEREERRHKEKEATTKSFVDLQLRALEVEEAQVKSILIEAEAKASSWMRMPSPGSWRPKPRSWPRKTGSC